MCVYVCYTLRMIRKESSHPHHPHKMRPSLISMYSHRKRDRPKCWSNRCLLHWFKNKIAITIIQVHPSLIMWVNISPLYNNNNNHPHNNNNINIPPNNINNNNKHNPNKVHLTHIILFMTTISICIGT